MVIVLSITALLIIGLVLLTKRKTKETEVAQGLQVFNENAEMILDVTDTLGKIMGYVDVSRKERVTDEYVIQDPKFLEGTPFIFSNENSFVVIKHGQPVSTIMGIQIAVVEPLSDGINISFGLVKLKEIR